MPANQIDTFMAAIRAIESGGGDPAGNYQAVNPSSGARGAYQIMPQYWDDWARGAGVPDADHRDPKMQDIVARNRMLNLYRKYGRWDYVAGAWFAGEGGLSSHLDRGNDPSDGNLHLSEYMDRARSLISELGGDPTPDARSPDQITRGEVGTSGGQASPYAPAAADTERQDVIEGAGRFFDTSDVSPATTSPRAQHTTPDLVESMLSSFSRSAMTSAQQRMGQEGLGASREVDGPATTDAATGTLLDDPNTLLEGQGPDPFVRTQTADGQQIGGAVADAATQLLGSGVSRSLGDVPEEEATANLPATMTTTEEAEGLGQQVLSTGEQYLGVPYQWGGSDPDSGFDCSGLVQHVFAELGVDLPRYSGDQAQAGSEVASLEEARPGDLVFWHGEGDRPNHIGIYAGDGKFLEAPRTGLNVRYREIASTPDTIRRVINE